MNRENKTLPECAKEAVKLLRENDKNRDASDVFQTLIRVFQQHNGSLASYGTTMEKCFGAEDGLTEEMGNLLRSRVRIVSTWNGKKVYLNEFYTILKAAIEETELLIQRKDRELFEDILANTVSRKIRGKINASNLWVQKMNTLKNGMDTSSGLKLSLRWRSKTAEKEYQLDTRELVELLKKDYRLMSEEEASRLSAHFRSKVAEARRNARDSAGMISFYQIMKDTLDYRKWFEFQLFSQKNGERQKELTNSVFGTFSGGEKAMSMYVPLFSAVVAKYQGGREDAPRLISLDEAFAGVDN